MDGTRRLDGVACPWSRRALLAAGLGQGALLCVGLGCGRGAPAGRDSGAGGAGGDGGGPAGDGGGGDGGGGGGGAGDGGGGDTGAAACEPVVPGSPDEGWVEVPLADWPALAEVGGSAVVAVPEALLWVLIACTAPGCWVALWSTCTHGACEVAWEPAQQAAVCPCHGSIFGADGAVLQGPATEPLATFPVGRQGDSLWVLRPL